jgi:hypothetical protein
MLNISLQLTSAAQSGGLLKTDSTTTETIANPSLERPLIKPELPDQPTLLLLDLSRSLKNEKLSAVGVLK